MMRQSQMARQSQVLQQRLSPQQIQYIKLLQLPTLMLEQRVKQEIEANPVLELDDENTDTDDLTEADEENEITEEEYPSNEENEDETSAVDENEEIDWDTFFHDTDEDYVPSYNKEQEFWRDLPKPYKSGFMESLEQQVDLLVLDERQRKIADEIVGSVEPDGYLRRELDTIIDAIAFNEGILMTREEAEQVLRKIQGLDPPGVAARDLRECLLIQLEMMDSSISRIKLAKEILEKAWPQYEKKHYDKICKMLNITEAQLREANQVIMHLNPKPGESDEYLNPDQFIVPDFEVVYEEAIDDSGRDQGEFVISLNSRNMPKVKISPHYREIWDFIEKTKDQSGRLNDTRQFIREKLDSARWFIESIQQRRNTLMAVMQTIVALQEEFFKTGKGLRPMILKDIADRIRMDISTVSRVVSGKYVQTPFGVFELKYFFTEGLETESGETISNREIKNILLELVNGEEKTHPLSDQALAQALKDRGYPVARRTISKYREQLNIPVARLRKEFE
ncbi:MAG: RNA polymerase factor sigma-54 [Balneolales bacterium]